MASHPTRRALLLLALVALPRNVLAQRDVVEFEATVIDSHPPPFACGILAVAGWATVRPSRVVAGSLPPGDVRVVIGCGSAPVGQHLRVRGVVLDAHATHFRIYSIMPPLPHDGVVAIGARHLTVLP